MPYNPNQKGLGFKNKKLNQLPTGRGAPSMPSYLPGGAGAVTKPDPRMPYKPGSGVAKTMPYTPGTGTTRQLSASMDGIDGRNDPPGYDRTMEYQPARDGSAWGQIPTTSGGADAQNYDGGYDGQYEDDDGEGERMNRATHDKMWDQAAGELQDLQQNGGDERAIEAFKQKWIAAFVNTGLDEDEARAWVDQLFTDGL